MRTRLLATLAVVAAALLVPSAALAAPTLLGPGPSPVVTNAAPVDFTWSDGAAEVSFRIVSGDPDGGGSCPTLPVNLHDVSGLLATSPMEYLFTPPVDGSACYYVEGNDGVGPATYSDAVLVTYDTTHPSVSVTAPADPSVVHGASVTVSANASDGGSGVTQVDFFAQGSGAAIPLGTDFTPTTGSYSVSWDTTAGLSPDGLYTVWAVATDAATLTTTSTVVGNVRVDNTQPSVSVTAPADPSVVHGASVTVSANASDGGSGVTQVDFFAQGSGAAIPLGTDFTPTTGSYSVSWDTTAGLSPDGLYTVWAVATDAATLTKTSTVVGNVRVDNTQPSVSVTAPAPSAAVHGSTVTVSANASDGGSGVTQVDFFAQGSGAAIPLGTDFTPTAGSYSVSWDTTAGLSPDGLYTVWAVATDAATLTKTSTIVSNVLVDNTGPTGSITTSQVTLANIHASVGIDASAADTGAGVDKVEFQSSPAGLNSWTTFDTDNNDNAPTYHGTLNTGAGADGVYDLRIKITDLAGNTAFSSVVTPVRVDNHAPTVPGNPTGQPAVISTPVVTFGASTDPNFNGFSGVDHYNVFRNGTPAGVVQAPATSFTDNSALADGFYTYTFVAVDKAGNPSVTASAGFQVHVDSTAASAPTSVTLLASPTNQRPQLSFVAPVSAPFLAHYNVYRNTALLAQTVAAGATSFTDSEASLPDGSYTYQLVATDGGSQFGVASAGVTIVYDTTAPAAPGGVTASAALDGTITIGWQPASDGSGSGIARYVVRRSLSSAPPATIADGDATCSGTATSCTDATALNGKLYSYAVFAVDLAGNTSLAGITPGVTAHDQTPPPAPKGLAATPADGSVSLRWTPAGPDDDVAGYVLVAKPGAQAPSSETDGTRVCTDIVSTSSACTATGLTNGATYTFGLFALDEALNRSQPAVVSAAPNGKVTDAKAPAAVSKLKAKVSGSKVTLTWKNPSDHDFDHVEITAGERKPSALKAAKRVYAGKGTKATTTIPAGQSRWFVVVAYDAVGNASEPATVHVTIPAPSKFGPAPRAKVHGKVKLSWPVVKGAKYYNVQVYAGKKRILVSWPSGRALQLPRAKLKVGKTYTWYVWPGLGAKAKAHYGKLIGKNAFTLTG